MFYTILGIRLQIKNKRILNLCNDMIEVFASKYDYSAAYPSKEARISSFVQFKRVCMPKENIKG